MVSSLDINNYIPEKLRNIKITLDLLPQVAKERETIKEIEFAVGQIPTNHKIYCEDARNVILEPSSVHLVLTSPPYWNLKKYPEKKGQLGSIANYRSFLEELEKVWYRCYDALVPGGRLICVVGDVCLSRRANNGTHTVVPLHSSIQENLIKIGFSNLAPIIWYKISNAKYEANGKTQFLGKPYEPGGIIKNDIEFIVMARKPGAYRKVASANRILSVISESNHREWFQQIWTGINGASTRLHPAPFPVKLAERLVRMFSFVGDVVLDPFMGTGSTNLAALSWGRNSIGVEIDSSFIDIALNRLREKASMFRNVNIEI
jgi:DNA modification methylase